MGKFVEKMWEQVDNLTGKTVILTVLFTLLVPLGIVFLLPSLLLHRLTAILLAKKFRPDLLHIFGGKGALLSMEPIYSRPVCNIVLHLVIQGSIPIETWRERFQERILDRVDPKTGEQMYPGFKQYWTHFMGFMFWKRELNFSLEKHIRSYDYTETELGLPGSECTESDLMRITGALIAQPWREGQSPWEILRVPNYVSSKQPGKSQCVLVFRIHHALADGYSIDKVIRRLADESIEDCGGRIKPNFPKLSLWQQLELAIRLPYDAVQLLLNSYDGPNCWHLLEDKTKLSRKYQVFYSDEITVEDVKKVRRTFGVPYNAVVSALTSAGIRGLMKEADQPVPQSMSVCTPFPLKNHPDGLVNHYTGTFFKTWPGLKTPEERLLKISKDLRATNEAPAGPIALSFLLDLITLLPVWVMKALYENAQFSLIMSNFPGPDRLYFGGNQLVDLYVALGHGPGKVGAAAVTVSLGKVQRIILTVDKSILQGSNVPSGFSECVSHELKTLLQQ